MFRGVILIAAMLLASLAIVAGVVVLGLHRVSEANKLADAGWHPTTAPAPIPVDPPATLPATAPSELEIGSVELWAKDAILHGNVKLADAGSDRGKADRAAREAAAKRRAAKDAENEAKARTPEAAARLHNANLAREKQMAERLRMRDAMGAHAPTFYLSGFHDPDDYVEWAVLVPKAGEYEIDMIYACPSWNGGGQFIIRLADQELPIKIQATRRPSAFRVVTLGTLKLPAGKSTLTLRPADNNSNNQFLINLRNVQIIPAS